MKLLKNKKSIGNALFLLVVFAATIWSVFRGEDLKAVFTYLSQANKWYLLPGLLCVIGYILGESVIIRHLLGSLGTAVPFFRCCLYSFVGFFYCCITPSASGGQPMQVVHMRRDGIPVAVSSIVLAIITIVYKLVLVLIGAAVLLLRPASIMPCLEPVRGMILLGMGLNVIFISALLLLVFDPMAVYRIANWCFAVLEKVHPPKHPENLRARLDRIVGQYQGASEFYRTHHGVMVRVFLLTFCQRTLLFLVTWFTYRAFGLSGSSLPTVVTLQAMISVAADMMPLPGGMGVSENLFLDIFFPIFGEALVLPGMMLSRGISYYTQLIISGIMTVYASFAKRK